MKNENKILVKKNEQLIKNNDMVNKDNEKLKKELILLKKVKKENFKGRIENLDMEKNELINKINQLTKENNYQKIVTKPKKSKKPRKDRIRF